MTLPCASSLHEHKMIFQLSLITFSIFFCIVTIWHSQTTAATDISRNTPPLPSKSNIRSKRFLIFEGGGVLKLVFGFSQPLEFFDKHPYRQLSVSYAFHIQYPTPTRPVYWWTYFVNSTAWAHARTSGSPRKFYFNDGPKLHKHHYNYDPHLNHYGTFVQRHYRQPAIAYDASRFVVYKAVETVFNSKGLPGERCLLRTICEISQRPLYEDNALHGIINAIFSPSVSNIDKKYLRAKKIGAHGMNCAKIYWSCNKSIKWLQEMSHYF